MANWFSRPPAAKPKALTASGQRVTPQTAPTLGARRNDWQGLSWTFRETVPEVRYVGGFVATQLSRVRWFVAETDPDGSEPRPVQVPEDDPPADDNTSTNTDDDYESDIPEQWRRVAVALLARLDMNSRGSDMAGRIGENDEYAGECYLLGEQDPRTLAERWTIRSAQEVKIGQDGRTVQLVEPGKTTGGRTLALADVELFRLWIPDPRYHDWADAKISSCHGVLDEIRAYDQQARAAARSRIARGDVLYLPHELSFTRPNNPAAPVAPPTDHTPVDDNNQPPPDLFMEQFTAAMLAPIGDENDPSAIVPIVVRGPAMAPDGVTPMKDVIGVVSIPREEIADLVAKREAAVVKYAHGVDMPPEMLTGLSDVNHWTGFVISDAVVKNYVEPRCERVADSLTESYFREGMLAQQCPPDILARMCVWFDASELAQPADPLDNALKLHEREAISDAALRRAAGYSDDDAPDDRERLLRLLAGGRLAPQAVPVIVALMVNGDDPELARAAEVAQQMTVATAALPGPSAHRQVIDYGTAGRTPPGPAGAVPASTATPPTGAPVPSGVTAAALPAAEPDPVYRVDEAACRALADIDTGLVADLGGYADAAVTDAVRVAGNRYRNHALRASASPAEREQFAGAARDIGDAAAIVAAAGPFPWSYSDDAAFDGTLDRIRDRWFSATAEAGRRVAAGLARITGRPVTAGFAEGIASRARGAWPAMAAQIRQVAADRLHGREGTHTAETATDTPVVPRSIITAAVTAAGGVRDTLGAPVDTAPATGLAAGSAVHRELTAAGAEVLGYRWRYASHPRAPFPPHEALSGIAFAGFTDPVLTSPPQYVRLTGPHLHPGDHKGCGCSIETLVASPTRPGRLEQLVGLHISDETPWQRQNRALAEADDAAGRTGTSAQADRDRVNEIRALQRRYLSDHARGGPA